MGVLAITACWRKVPELPGDPELGMRAPPKFYENVHRYPYFLLGRLEGAKWRPKPPGVGFLAFTTRRHKVPELPGMGMHSQITRYEFEVQQLHASVPLAWKHAAQSSRTGTRACVRVGGVFLCSQGPC